MLRIKIDEIPDSGIEIHAELGEEWVRPLLMPQYIWSGRPISVSFVVQKAKKNLVVNGKISGVVAFLCSRCAEEALFQIHASFTHLFLFGKSKEMAFEEEEVTFDDTPEVTFFDGDIVDLEPLAAEEFVLSLPQYPRCSDDCRGLCQRCGANLNQGLCNCKDIEENPVWAELKKIRARMNFS